MNQNPTRQFAIDVVRRLQAAGFEALWAGGCVRDELFGKQPQDYDVATSALPEQVRDLFGRRHTHAVGAAFGVITILGPRSASPVEVATFRTDGDYADGRRPESVHFSSAEHDAQRRDFTINGLFSNPLTGEIVDYVGGQEDLKRGIIRAIGDPAARFAEDKLRLLRAVRFSATFDFELEAATAAAISRHAASLQVVSVERISNEMQKMLRHSSRCRAIELCTQLGLQRVLFAGIPGHEAPGWPGDRSMQLLSRLQSESFELGLVALLVDTQTGLAKSHCQAWKLSNDQTARIVWIHGNVRTLSHAIEHPWPQIQRLLIQPFASEAVEFAEQLLAVDEPALEPDRARIVRSSVEFCHHKLSLPREELDPVPLIDGNDLKRLGVEPGPRFKNILGAVRDAQLLGELQQHNEAVDFVRRMTNQQNLGE